MGIKYVLTLFRLNEMAYILNIQTEILGPIYLSRVRTTELGVHQIAQLVENNTESFYDQGYITFIVIDIA